MSNQTEKADALAAWQVLDPNYVSQADKDTLAGFATRLSVYVAPPVANLVPAVGMSMTSLQYADGPADWIDLSKLPAPTPWELPVAFIPSNNGVKPTSWKRIHPWGATSGLYSQVPMIKNGGIVQYSPHLGTFVATITPALKADPPPVGARGIGLVDPYITWHGHPGGGPLYLGIRLDGAMVALMPNGTSYIMGMIPNTNSPLDWSLTPDRMVFLVADSYNGRILKIDRTASRAVRIPPAPEDPALWAITTLAGGLGTISSLRTLPNGITYACDNTNNAILKIMPDGTVSTILTIYKPWFIDYTSDNQLVVLTQTRALYILDPANPVLGTNLNASMTNAGLTTFLTVEVDRTGTIGPIDDMFLCWVQGNANTDFHRITRAGVRTYSISPLGNGQLLVGESQYNHEMGHYPWVHSPHPEQGILLAQGFSNPTPSLFMAPQPGDPQGDVYNHNAMMRGIKLLKAGTTYVNPVSSRPSFTAQVGIGTHSLIGVTGDYIAKKTYADAAAYVQAGMAGSVPRPEMVGYDLYCLLYLFYRNSQRYLAEGKTLIDGLKAYMVGVAPNYATATPEPLLTTWTDSTIFLRADKVGSEIVVTGKDKYGNNKTIDPAAQIQVTVDKGTANEVVLGTNGAPWKFPLPVAGRHALMCSISGATGSYLNQTRLVTV